MGTLVVAELNAPLHFWSRKPHHVRNDGQEVFIFGLIRESSGELTQLGGSAPLGPGDLVLYDSDATFDCALKAKTQLVKLPKRLLESKLDRPSDFLALKIDRANPLSTILGELLTRCLDIDLSLDLGPRIAKRCRKRSSSSWPQFVISNATPFPRRKLPGHLSGSCGLRVRIWTTSGPRR